MRSILRLFLCFFLQAAVFCVYGQEDLQKLRIEAEMGGRSMNNKQLPGEKYGM